MTGLIFKMIEFIFKMTELIFKMTGLIFRNIEVSIMIQWVIFMTQASILIMTSFVFTVLQRYPFTSIYGSSRLFFESFSSILFSG